MLDWSINRQAMWMYNNQHNIDQELYKQQLEKNDELRKEIEKLKKENAPINPNYVDPEFQENPDLMYTDEHVEAAYNPVVYQSQTVNAENTYTIILIILLIVILVIVSAIYFVFFHQF
jgi:hypothetical protein